MINSVKGAEGISISTTGYSNAFLTLVAHNLKCNFLLFHNRLLAQFQRQIFLEVRGGFGLRSIATCRSAFDTAHKQNLAFAVCNNMLD